MPQTRVGGKSDVAVSIGILFVQNASELSPRDRFFAFR